ncbi:MAG TPA: cysteine peptidase family C39 domain-containing protein [Planctomycetota bacterium]
MTDKQAISQLIPLEIALSDDTSGDPDVFDLNQLRPLFGPRGDRASLARLLRQAESMGYTPVIAALDWERLRRERRPIITRVAKEDFWDDYVLLRGMDAEEVIMVDGELRVRRLSREDFGRLWAGWIVILQRRGD